MIIIISRAQGESRPAEAEGTKEFVLKQRIRSFVKFEVKYYYYYYSLFAAAHLMTGDFHRCGLWIETSIETN